MTVSFRQHREFLIDYLRPQRLAVAVMSVLLLGSIALQLVTPQILSRFIDAARAGGAPDTLVRLAVLSLMVAGRGSWSRPVRLTPAKTWDGPRPTKSARTWPCTACGWICRSTTPKLPAR